MLHIFSLRDKGPQGHSIKEMSNEPSRDDLHEMAKAKCRDGAVSPARGVERQLEQIRDNKKSGRLEHGTFEHLTVDFWDLIDVITSTGKVVDVGYEGTCWSLNIRGTTSLGVELNVWCNLNKKEDRPLQITSFQPTLDS